MSYEQVQTILKHVHDVHTRAAEIYENLAARCEHQRTTMLLQYMSRHERELADAVSRSAEDTDPGVLGTWLQLSASSKTLLDSPELSSPPTASDLSTDDVVELAAKVDGRVITMYEDLAERSDPEHVQQLFQNLLDEERQEERLMVRQALRGDDL